MLRVAAIFHILFSICKHDEVEDNDQIETMSKNPDQLDKVDIKAAINFVKTSMQNVLYIIGKGSLEDEIQTAGL